MKPKQSTARWLAVVVALQAATLWSLWAAAPRLTTARADGIPDSGAQRQQIIEQLKSTNDKLDQLIAILSGGKLQVTVTKPDDTSH